MKKNLIIILALFPLFNYGQQLYNDFEVNGVREHVFGFRHGSLDTTFINMDDTGINNSVRCARYVRSDNAIYDIIHMRLLEKLSDVSNYSSSFSALKIKMKMYTEAPVGTPIELQLGSFINDSYPSGVHSVYVTQTSVQNEWEVLVFDFWETPFGSATPATSIDRITLLINPDPQTLKADTFYFDDLTGPAFLDVSITEQTYYNKDVLDQNYPNPARNNTTISFEIKENTYVQLDLFDLHGKKISSLAKGVHTIGTHKVNINVKHLQSGIYMYQLQTGTTVINRRMIVY
ncbi:MAG: T9SS type A sorting domain-containing protein [Bacteroidota bacterium]|nr:T9SS type A sorting domain-containing protein [Bacteroidota bacterium]